LIVEETTIHGEIFNGQLLEVDTENIPDTSAESAINDVSCRRLRRVK
jgi:hypothetical protein